MFFLAALVSAAAIGFLSQRTGLCMVKGVLEAREGRPVFLMAILGSGVLIWVAGVIALPFGHEVPFQSARLSLWAVCGGILFGLGASMNGGCGVSTITRLASGAMGYLATILGWVIGWILLAEVSPNVMVEGFTLPTMWHYAVLIGWSILALGFSFTLSPESRGTWLGIMGVGLLAGIVFIYEANWTPSSMLHGISLAVWNMDNSQWPAPQNYLFVAVVIAGMATSALLAHTFRLQIPSWIDSMRHFFAGILMGVGASLAMGGNDWQLLLALPALSPAGFGTVVAMLAGIYLGSRATPLFQR